MTRKSYNTVLLLLILTAAVKTSLASASALAYAVDDCAPLPT